jgi:polygalacturonase
MVLGSEMSGGVKDLTVSQCYFKHTDRGLRIKTRRGRGKYAVIDGVEFSKKAEGIFRVFGGEEIIRMKPHRARYIRLEILSTTGKASMRKNFMDAALVLAELTPMTKYRRK